MDWQCHLHGLQVNLCQKLLFLNVEGALNLTGEARDKSMEAKQKVEMVKMDGGHLSNSDKQRKATEGLMTSNSQQFTKTQEEIQQTLTDVVSSISNLETKIPGNWGC